MVTIIVICYSHIFFFFFQISDTDDITVAKNEAQNEAQNEAHGTEPAYGVIFD